MRTPSPLLLLFLYVMLIMPFYGIFWRIFCNFIADIGIRKIVYFCLCTTKRPKKNYIMIAIYRLMVSVQCSVFMAQTPLCIPSTQTTHTHFKLHSYIKLLIESHAQSNAAFLMKSSHFFIYASLKCNTQQI